MNNEYLLYRTEKTLAVLMNSLEWDMETGEILNPEVLDEIERLTADKTELIEAIGIEIKEESAIAKQIEEEEKALYERRKAHNARAEKLERLLLNTMLADDMTKFESAKIKVTTRKTAKVIVNDEDACREWLSLNAPTALKMPEPKPAQIVKAEVKKLITSGNAVAGAEVFEDRTVTVK